MLGLVCAAVLMLRASTAVFTAQTTSTGNTIGAGTVSLTDDDAGNALFNLSGLIPGDRYAQCITVTYGGTIVPPAPIKVYATSASGTLGSYLQFSIEEGTGGISTSCTGFTNTATVFNQTQPVASTGTLAAFTAASTNYSSGVGTWTPSATGQSIRYRVIADLVGGDNAAVGLTAQVTLNWATRN